MHPVSDDTRVKPPIPPPPADPMLPGLGRLLDRDLLSAHWADAAGEGPRVRVRRVTYRPGLRCEVTYAVDGPAGSSTAVATAVSAARRSDAPSPAGFDTELEAVVRWLPDDPALPQMAALAADLPSILDDLGITGDGDVQLLGYRSGERAVFAAADVVLKLYRREADLDAAVVGFAWAESALGSAAPRLLAVDRLRRLTVQQRVDGRQLTHKDCHEAVPAAAELLSRLHASAGDGAPRHSAVGVLAHVDVAVALVRTILPDLAGRVDRLAARLRDDAPPRNGAVTAHGDFNVSQIIRRLDGGHAVLDFDEHCIASPSLDLAAYAANATSGRSGESERVQVVIEDLAVAYGRRPADLTWYLAAAIMCRAPSPFRLQKRDWPERTAAIVAAAEGAFAA